MGFALSRDLADSGCCLRESLVFREISNFVLSIDVACFMASLNEIRFTTPPGGAGFAGGGVARRDGFLLCWPSREDAAVRVEVGVRDELDAVECGAGVLGFGGRRCLEGVPEAGWNAGIGAGLAAGFGAGFCAGRAGGRGVARGAGLGSCGGSLPFAICSIDMKLMMITCAD